MENSAVAGGSPEASGAISTGDGSAMTRKEKRKILKKLKRKQLRRDMAIREKEEEEARLNDPEEQLRLKKMEEEERERSERERRLFEERERLWIEAKKKEEEEAERQRKLPEEANKDEKGKEENLEKSDGDDGEWEYVETGPAEIIWKGNEIIVKKKTIKVPKANAQKGPTKEDAERPTSNPLPPQSEAFSSHSSVVATVPAQELLNKMAQETPNFGTEQDKAHCPFHLKTGVCRFGLRCNRAHFYPEKSCTLLMKNMYVGPGLAWELDEGLECTDEEVEHSYEEFYEDVHTEFLKFGELVNFKVCRNSSYHLRGNVYVHYKSLDSAVFAYESINGRYFAGKQITCEFVSVTRWKVAICGEYMKSRLKSCSRGSTCNFLHCFRNPGGDYEWADWDKPPPKYWINKMVSLFGFSDQSYYDNKAVELGDVERLRNSDWRRTPTSDRYDSRRKKESRGHDSLRDDSDLEREDRKRKRDSSRFEKQPTRDSDRNHSTRERSYDGRLESSSHKHKERSNKEYHKEDSTKNKTESNKLHQYKEAKEVSEESYSEEETDGRREESKRHWDKYSDGFSYDEKLESSHRHEERSNREYHKEDSTKNKTESKRRQRYNKAKDVSEECHSEEETDGRREESKRRRDKYSDDLSDTESRRNHSTSKKRSHRRKHRDDDNEEEKYENSDSSLRKHGRTGEGREHRKKGEERRI